MKSNTKLSKTRLIFGGLVFISGFFSPLLVPVITNTSWSVALKTTISGLLIFGIPELFIVIAIAITGKRGLGFLKKLLYRYLRGFLSKNVTKLQYRIGLAMIFLPLIVGWLFPYLNDFIVIPQTTKIVISITLDVVMVLGVFIAGEIFWEKFKSIFIYDVPDYK